MEQDRIWNGTVVRDREGNKGVVISQTSLPRRVVVRYPMFGEWEEDVIRLTIVPDEKPIIDGTRVSLEPCSNCGHAFGKYFGDHIEGSGCGDCLPDDPCNPVIL